MIGLNSRIPVQIQTRNGIIPIEKATVGDIVYEYKSGKELEIKQIIQSDIDDVYKIKYTDGRISCHMYSDLVFTGDIITDVKTLLNRDQYSLKRNPEHNSRSYVGNIVQYPMEYKYPISTPLFPDPYITGALLTYGEFNDPYINLPLDRRSADQLFAHKYHLNFADKLGNNKVYFRFDGNSGDQLITWNEFFPHYDIYATSRNSFSPMIPIEYTRASLNNRWQFIQGVFDIGYSIDMFPGSVGIAHINEIKLLEIQKMLLSIGVLSKISYDPNLPLAQGRNYRLDIIGKYDGYPGFFYDINNIERALLNDTRLIKHDPDFKLQMSSIEWLTMGYIYNIVLDQPNMLYMTDNFLPRVSL